MLNQFLEYPVQPLWSVVWLLALPVHNLPCVYYNNYSTISPAFTRKKKYMIEFLVKGMKYVALIDIWEITWIVDAHFPMQDTSNVIIINRILILVLQHLIVLLYHPAFHCPCLHEPFGMYVPYTYACHSVQVMKLNFSIQEVNFSDSASQFIWLHVYFPAMAGMPNKRSCFPKLSLWWEVSFLKSDWRHHRHHPWCNMSVPLTL